MLIGIRARSSSIAFALLLAFAVTSTAQASAAHGSEDHDTGCAPAVAVAHDESAHTLDSPGADGGHPLHCLVCHWARTFRLSTVTGNGTAPVLCQQELVRTNRIPAPRAVDAAQLTLRAPPL